MKTNLKTLKYVKAHFDMQSDHSTKTNGYRILCEMIETVENSGIEQSEPIQSKNDECVLCHGTGMYFFGGSFGGAVQVRKCYCKDISETYHTVNDFEKAEKILAKHFRAKFNFPDTGHYNRYIIDAMIEFKNQSSVNPTDDDIENAATDYINDAGVDLFCTDVEALVNAAYMAGAKEIRDNKIHISKSKV